MRENCNTFLLSIMDILALVVFFPYQAFVISLANLVEYKWILTDTSIAPEWFAFNNKPKEICF